MLFPKFKVLNIAVASVFGLTLLLPGAAFASIKTPKCKDVKSATKASNRAAIALERAQKKLTADKAWMSAASAQCNTPGAMPKLTAK